MPPSTSPPAPPASPRLFCTTTVPSSTPAAQNRSTTARLGRMYSSVFLPSITPRQDALVRKPDLPGSKAVLLRGVKPEWILRAVTEEKCTIVWLLVPWAQDLLDAIEAGKVDLNNYLLDQWRLMHIGAQPVPPSLIHRWQKLFPHHAYDTNYGLSENHWSRLCTPGRGKYPQGRGHRQAWLPLASPDCRRQGREVPQGDIGELIVSGPGVMLCYYKESGGPPRRF